jgi:hypothetical protein
MPLLGRTNASRQPLRSSLQSAMYEIAVSARVLLVLVFGLAGISELIAGSSASRMSLGDFGVPPRLRGIFGAR